MKDMERRRICCDRREASVKGRWPSWLIPKALKFGWDKFLKAAVAVCAGMRPDFNGKGLREHLSYNDSPGCCLDFLKVGTPVLIRQRIVQARVVETVEEGVVNWIWECWTLTSFEGHNIPSVKVPLPTLTQKDIEDIRFACQEGFDLIAASFIRKRRQCFEKSSIFWAIWAGRTCLFLQR